MSKNLSWRDVLDCKKNAGTELSDFLILVKESGYSFFTWNGDIYRYIGMDGGVPVYSKIGEVNQIKIEDRGV